MSRFWMKCESGGLSEQDVALTVVSFEGVPLDALDDLQELKELDVAGSSPTSLTVCRWCDGPASPSLDDCCLRCLEKLERRATMREQAVPNNSRIDFY